MPVRSGTLLQPVPKPSSRPASDNILFVCVIDSLLHNGEVLNGFFSRGCPYMPTGQSSTNPGIETHPAKTDQPNDRLLHGNADGDRQNQAAIQEGKKKAA